MNGMDDQRVRGHLAHLGASGLLIGRDTALGAIHHGPLGPIDTVSLMIVPIADPLQLDTSIIRQCKPPSLRTGMLRMLGERQGGDMEKLPRKANLRLKGQHCGKQIFSASQNTNGEYRKKKKNVTTQLFPFLGKTVLEKLHYC